MRGPVPLAIVALAVALAVMFTRDPEEAWAVALVIVALGIAAGALVAAVLLRRTGGRRRGGTVRRAVATRRGAEAAIVVALLLWLRAVDGLSFITAGFVVGAFVVAEAVLSARPASSR